MIKPGTFIPAAAEPHKLEIRRVHIKPVDSSRCELALQIGIFFDGTGNNRNRDRAKAGDSNIARLSDAYAKKAASGLVRIYVPGVGTPCRELSEEGENWMGSAFGSGCEARVLLGILTVLNEIHLCAFPNRTFISPKLVSLLCTKGSLSANESAALCNMGLAKGLAGDATNGTYRTKALRKLASQLGDRLKQGSVRINQCIIDVFGFSRGAAEARVFCNWLNDVLIDGALAEIPIQIRFLGIFDTVASAGISSAVVGAAFNLTGGHDGWARPQSLIVPNCVMNCVHMVAMHEIRKNFPLDEASIGGRSRPGVFEVAYPGTHSDIGGGYAPGELGIAVDGSLAERDSNKISQIPLNHMYSYAKACGVPLDKSLAAQGRTDIDPFAVSSVLIQDFNEFAKTVGMSPKSLYQWTNDYLAWRWQMRDRYTTLRQVSSSSAEHGVLLRNANRKLKHDAELLISCADKKTAKRYKDAILAGTAQAYDQRYVQQSLELPHLDMEAWAVLNDAINTKIPLSLARFFDLYIHDSYAGFSANISEPTGYWRYRKAFQGSAQVTVASNATEAEDAAV